MPNNVASLWSPTRQTFFGCSLFSIPFFSLFLYTTNPTKKKKKKPSTVSVNRYTFYSIKCNIVSSSSTQKLAKLRSEALPGTTYTRPTPIHPPNILTSFRKIQKIDFDFLNFLMFFWYRFYLTLSILSQQIQTYRTQHSSSFDHHHEFYIV